MRILIIAFFIFCFGILTGFNGCQTTANFYYDKSGQYVEITDPPGQCVLYKVLGGTSQYMRTGLFVANYAAIKAGYYSSADAMSRLDILEAEALRVGATVGSFINTLFTISAEAAKVGAPEMIVITEGLGPYRGDMTPLDDCTIYKLVAYIGSQKNLVRAFASQGR